MAALTPDVAAWVVAWILSCRLLLLSERWREEGEDGVEDDGYFTGETEPFIMDSSEEAIVVCPVEERDERDDLPPLDESVESTEVFKEDKLEMFLTEERFSVVDPRAVLKGRFELYMLYCVFGDAGAVI